MKKVFIGVLAALMLFAFTACEQSMPSYKQVEYVTLDQTQAFIENQPLSAEAFSVTVHYLDGSLDVFSGTGRVTFVNSTAEGATAVPDATATANVYAKATVAGESDIIGIKTVKATAFTATVTANDVTRSYEQVGSTDEYAPKEAAVTLNVTGATLTGDENASWTLSATDVATKVSAPNDVKLTSEEQMAVGAVEKEVTLTLTGTEIKYTTTVSVNVKASTTDEHDPEYVAPSSIAAIEMKDVTKLGVIWVNADQDDFLPSGDDGKTPAKYDVDDVVTGATVSNTITVGETPAYTIVGLAADMTGKAPIVLSTDSGLEAVSGATLDKTATDGSDVTGIKYDGADEATKALTATFNFVPENEAGIPNYDARFGITLNVTVEDKLADSQSSFELYYNGEKAEDEWTAAKIDVAKVSSTLTLNAKDFKGELTTVGKQFVEVSGSRLYGNDKISYTKEELTALVGTGIDVNVEVVYDGEYGKYSDSVAVHIDVENSGN